MQAACGRGFIDHHRDGMRLPNGTVCGTIGDIRPRELERSSGIVAAAGIELRGMVREGE